MPFHTRTEEAGTVIWSYYDTQPSELADGEIQCTEAEYEAGRSDLWTSKPATDATALTTRAKRKNADKSA